MALNWKSVTAAHVSHACDALLHPGGRVAPPRGLIITYKDNKLPAKAVLRLAYCLANNMPTDTKLKFSSGDASLNLLRALGFQAERLSA